MVGLKIIATVVILFFLLLQGITGGQFLNWFVPDSDLIIGKSLCWAGGFIANPLMETPIGKVPLPVTDNFIFASFCTMLLLWLFFRRMKSMKRILLAVAISMIVLMFLWSYLGVLMVYFAETTYGQSNCIEVIDLGFVNIEFAWFTPFLMIGVGMALISLFAMLYRFWRRKSGGDA